MKMIASSRLYSVSILIWLTCLCLAAQPCVAMAQANAPEPLQPEAQEALNKGIIAAKLPDYPLAIRYFEEARKIAPQDPVIYLNLGLAESRIPGRELRAIAWFGAYLAAYAEAPNTAAVKEQIAMLEVKNQSNLLRLIKTVEDAAGQLADNDPYLVGVAIMWAEVGDFSGAQKTIGLIKHSLMKSRALTYLADAEIEKGDVIGARNTLAAALKSADRIDREPHIGITTPKGAKNQAIAYIAKAQAKSGDSVGAQKTFDLIDDASSKRYHLTEFEKTGFPNAPIPTRQSPSIKVSDWLRILDDKDGSKECPLNTGLFLDLADYLKKSMSQGTNSYGVYSSLKETAEKIIKAQKVIHQMLKAGG